MRYKKTDRTRRLQVRKSMAKPRYNKQANAINDQLDKAFMERIAREK